LHAASAHQILGRYHRFIQHIDAESKGLFGRHRLHIKCRAGCALCCTRITVLPLEWHALRVAHPDVLRERSSARRNGERSTCAFLKDNVCTVYGARPTICRLQGLALRYEVEEYDWEGKRIHRVSPQWQLRHCDLNFTSLGADESRRLLVGDNLVQMPEVNRVLSSLNEVFLATPPGERFTPGQRVFLDGDGTV
jgi:hypothetical protein